MQALIRRRALLQASVATSLPWGPMPSRAQTLPDMKSLQLVVPTPPGSQPDLIARWLVEPLARRAGLPATVINRPGAAGAIAADAVMAAPLDSGTLLLGGLDHVAYSHLNSNRRPLDPFVDFVPAGSVNRDTWVLAIGTAQPTQTFAEWLEPSRKTGGLSYGSTGEGSTAHLLTARLCKATGIEAQHVPYKESWLPDLIAGRIHFVVAPTPAVIGQVKGGRLRVLATLTDERLGLIDAVPTLRELGWPNQVFHGGLLLFVPAGLAPHAARINGWLVETLAQPDIVQRYSATAMRRSR